MSIRFEFAPDELVLEEVTTRTGPRPRDRPAQRRCEHLRSCDPFLDGGLRSRPDTGGTVCVDRAQQRQVQCEARHLSNNSKRAAMPCNSEAFPLRSNERHADQGDVVAQPCLAMIVVLCARCPITGRRQLNLVSEGEMMSMAIHPVPGVPGREPSPAANERRCDAGTDHREQTGAGGHHLFERQRCGRSRGQLPMGVQCGERSNGERLVHAWR